MPKHILVEELYLSFFLPKRLPAKQQAAIRKTLRKPGFQVALHRAVEVVTQRRPILRPVTVKLAR